MCELARLLAAHQGTGSVVAPAGFGKTHLIAMSVARSVAGRQLVLTHTYAGVNALRRKMRALKVPSASFHIDTIASWALRLCLSYSATSGWTTQRPADNAQWTALYAACCALLGKPFITRLMRASYAGVYVDEYQDCAIAQHTIVCKLAALLPCRVLGDPLQGIFDFGDQAPVDWERDALANFATLGQLDTPHRWERAGTPAIGTWLRAARTRLEQGQQINLAQGLPEGITYRAPTPQADMFRTQANTCRYFTCARNETVIAIHKGSQQFKARCHSLARNLSGRFSSIEEIEGKDLFSFVKKIEEAETNTHRLKEVIEFAGKCFTAVDASLPAGTLRGERTEIRANTKAPVAARWANEYLANPSGANMSGFLTALKNLEDVELIRADLFNRAMGVLRKQNLQPELPFGDAAEKYHGEFRYNGRPVANRKLIGTTLLVKGLEFDHAIVLDATSLSKKELYVALTRGAKSLTIISSSPLLNPQA